MIRPREQYWLPWGDNKEEGNENQNEETINDVDDENYKSSTLMKRQESVIKERNFLT